MKVLYKTITNQTFDEDFSKLAPIITIGNFDGCHIGHQELIRRCVNSAKEKQTSAVGMTFDPNPKSFFQPQTKIPKLFTESQKIRAFAELGMDALLIQQFDAHLANMSATDFYQDLLQQQLHCC